MTAHNQNPTSTRSAFIASPCLRTDSLATTAMTETTRSCATTSGSTTTQPSSSSLSGRRVGSRRPASTSSTAQHEGLDQHPYPAREQRAVAATEEQRYRRRGARDQQGVATGQHQQAVHPGELGEDARRRCPSRRRRPSAGAVEKPRTPQQYAANATGAHTTNHRPSWADGDLGQVEAAGRDRRCGEREHQRQLVAQRQRQEAVATDQAGRRVRTPAEQPHHRPRHHVERVDPHHAQRVVHQRVRAQRHERHDQHRQRDHRRGRGPPQHPVGRDGAARTLAQQPRRLAQRGGEARPHGLPRSRASRAAYTPAADSETAARAASTGTRRPATGSQPRAGSEGSRLPRDPAPSPRPTA